MSAAEIPTSSTNIGPGTPEDTEVTLVPGEPATGLSPLEIARRAIEQAKSVDELKNIRDKAESVRAYQKRVGESLEIQNACAEIKLCAERRIGELLRDMVERGQRDAGKGGDRSARSQDGTVPKAKLADLGVSKKASSRWQRIASLPEDDFLAEIEEVKAHGGELTSAHFLRRAARFQREQNAASQETSSSGGGEPAPTRNGPLSSEVRDGEPEGDSEEDEPQRYDVVVLDRPWWTAADRELAGFDLPLEEHGHLLVRTPPKHLPRLLRFLRKRTVPYQSLFVIPREDEAMSAEEDREPPDNENCEIFVYARRGEPRFTNGPKPPVLVSASEHRSTVEALAKVIAASTTGLRALASDRIDRVDGFYNWTPSLERVPSSGTEADA